ncbi:FecCD family ABC transporter permease [Nocardiopsis dassonvillei]|uniref:FecCD family ABC transporter permease n=1 Tax=Nocardiopsis dassonvillei TaxID=2014 RepID=UPI0036F8786E
MTAPRRPADGVADDDAQGLPEGSVRAATGTPSPEQGGTSTREPVPPAVPSGTSFTPATPKVPSEAAVPTTAPAASKATTTPAAPRDRRALRRLRAALLLASLTGGLVAVAVVAAGAGAYPIPPGQVAASLLHALGLEAGTPPDRIGHTVLWDVRLPRVVLAVMVGAALGAAGAMMQGVFGNPLAEPGVIGVSSGAAVGAIAVIFTGLTVLGHWTIIASSFVFGLATTLFVYVFARSRGRTEVVTLLLTGIAVNAIAGAAIGLMTNFSQDAEIQTITFWQLGSVSTATWAKVAAIAPCLLLGLSVIPFHARRLDLLALGEGPARHLGVDVERTRLVLICAMALLTSAAVAFAGIVSFVGLVVPHIIRMVTGPGHRVLLPASALGGGLLLLAADLLARTVAAPAEIPLGVVTAALGGPFFFYLLYRTRARQGGWS